MAELTDPANELVQLARRLSQNSNRAGFLHLSDTFNVKESSTEFYTLVQSIVERADTVALAVSRCSWDGERKEAALDVLNGFKSAFSITNLNKTWNAGQGVGPQLMRDHGRVIDFLSPMVRETISYPTFTDEERDELLSLIDSYLEEVKKNEQLEPFVRRAIVDSVRRFRFRLKHLEWGGAGCTLEGFRELAQAYEWVRQSEYAHEFNSKAALDGLLGILRKTKELADTAKDWSDTASNLYKGYLLASGIIAPLMITHQAAGG